MRDHAAAETRYREILDGLRDRMIVIPESVANVLAVWGQLGPGAGVIFGNNKLLLVESEVVELSVWDQDGVGITLELASVRAIKSITMTPDTAGAEERTRWERHPTDTNRPFPGCAFRLMFKRPIANQTELEFLFRQSGQLQQLETMLNLYRRMPQN